MKKDNMLIIIIAIFAVILASTVTAEKCCVNPGAPSLVICALTSIDNCCPTPEHRFVEYYSVPSPDGPAGFDECQNDFFNSTTGLNCNSIPDCSVDVCCCYPRGEYTGSKITNKVECKSLSGQPFEESELDGDESCEQHCGTFQPPPPPECADPKPGSLRVSSIKGEKGVRIEWTNPCGATAFEVSRCKGNTCENFQSLALTGNRTYYSDFSINLLWNNFYRYRVTARYATGGDFSDNRSIELGDLECWQHYDNALFCLFNRSYELEPYKRYLLEYEGFDSSDIDMFRSQVATIFGNKFNKAYSCDDNNRLSSNKSYCGNNQVCAIRRGGAVCITPTICRTMGKPFSLFNTKQNCENIGQNYCFFDRSYTNVDDCYDCKPFMGCYDYKTESACRTNNCGAGNCRWNSTEPELGIGVCVDMSTDNCKWCELNGTPEMENLEAYNTVFDKCTQKKKDALSSLNNCNVRTTGPTAKITVE